MLSAACHAGSEYRFVHILLQFSVLISGGSSFLSFRISVRIFALSVTFFSLLLHWFVEPIITGFLSAFNGMKETLRSVYELGCAGVANQTISILRLSRKSPDLPSSVLSSLNTVMEGGI